MQLQTTVCSWVMPWVNENVHVLLLLLFIICGGKLLHSDCLRQEAFFLNHKGTFGYQEGMITWCWLVITCLTMKCYCLWKCFATRLPILLKPTILKHSSENKNTIRNTLYYTGVLKQWAVTGKIEKDWENWQLRSVTAKRLSASQIFCKAEEGKWQRVQTRLFEEAKIIQNLS